MFPGLRVGSHRDELGTAGTQLDKLLAAQLFGAILDCVPQTRGSGGDAWRWYLA